MQLPDTIELKADVYDATRKQLLRGREDMLGLVAAQLQYKSERGSYTSRKPIWVDIGGGTGYNIEAMQAYVDVPTFFEKVFLVDLSPSLLQVARRRFSRLGWDVEIVCQDARTFRLEDYMQKMYKADKILGLHYSFSRSGADLITMSYSLSMMPDYYSILDSLPSLLAADGTIGVVDFYVQSIVELSGRTYTGGSFNRHVTWIGRVFWRAWFDVDRVGLEGARRDYLEYRFGTLKSVDERNYLLGGIPYYSGLDKSEDLNRKALTLPQSFLVLSAPLLEQMRRNQIMRKASSKAWMHHALNHPIYLRRYIGPRRIKQSKRLCQSNSDRKPTSARS